MFQSPLSSQEKHLKERDGKLEKAICLEKLSLQNKGDAHSLQSSQHLLFMKMHKIAKGRPFVDLAMFAHQ